MMEKDWLIIFDIAKFLWNAAPYIVGFLVGVYVGIPLLMALFPPDGKHKNGD